MFPHAPYYRIEYEEMYNRKKYFAKSSKGLYASCLQSYLIDKNQYVCLFVFHVAGFWPSSQKEDVISIRMYFFVTPELVQPNFFLFWHRIFKQRVQEVQVEICFCILLCINYFLYDCDKTNLVFALKNLIFTMIISFVSEVSLHMWPQHRLSYIDVALI